MNIIYIYHFFMQKQNRLSRSRPLIQKCKNERTDRLYFPLRNALVQSSKSKQKSCINYTNANNDLKCSRISQRAKMIDPVQAQYLIHEIYVPSDSELIPTKDLSRVKSKSFVAIQSSLKYNTSISQDQFLERQKNSNTVQKIVYEASHPKIQYFPSIDIPKTNQNKTPTSPKSHHHHSHIKSSIYTQNSNTKFSQYTQCTQKKYQPISTNNNNSVYEFSNIQQNWDNKIKKIVISDFSNILQQELKNGEDRRRGCHDGDRAKIGKIGQIGKDFGSRGKILERNLTDSGKSGISLTSQEQKNNLSRFAITTEYNKQKNDGSIIQETSEIKNKKRYRGLKVMSNKPKYAYNLFSCLDEPVNTGCTSCGKLEVIATKKQHPWS